MSQIKNNNSEDNPKYTCNGKMEIVTQISTESYAYGSFFWQSSLAYHCCLTSLRAAVSYVLLCHVEKGPFFLVKQRKEETFAGRVLLSSNLGQKSLGHLHKTGNWEIN